MIRLLLSLLRPMRDIAVELKTIRRLYEAELAMRQPPVYLLTEKAKKTDTVVSYQGVKEERPFYKRWLTSEEEPDGDGEE